MLFVRILVLSRGLSLGQETLPSEARQLTILYSGQSNLLPLLLRHHRHRRALALHHGSTLRDAVLAREDADLHVPKGMGAVVCGVGGRVPEVCERRGQYQCMERGVCDGDTGGQ